MMCHPNEPYRQLISSLHTDDVSYALLRDDLASEHPIRDLDLLVSKSDNGVLHRIASIHGYYLIKESHLNPGKRVYLKFVNGKPYMLDVHESIVCRGIEFLDSEKALSRRKMQDGFYRLSNDDSLLSLLFHNILAKSCIQEKHYPLLQDLFDQPLDREYLHSQLRAYGLLDIFETIERDFRMACEQPAYVKKLAKRARRKLLLRKPANLLRVLHIQARERTVKIVGKHRGVVVAFLGPDGAGKSTTIQAIQARLKDVGIGSKVAYLGPWGGSILNLRTIFSRLHLTPYRDDYKAYHKGLLEKKPGPLKGFKNIRFQIRSGLYYVLLVLEMAARWRVKVMPLLRQGRVVLCDRYIYDMLTGYKNKPIDYHISLRESICDRFPKPDIGILLDAEPEVIYTRKPQLSEKQLQHSRDAYHKIAQKYGFIKLDTSRDLQTTLRDFEKQILPIILEKLSQRNDRSESLDTTVRQESACHPAEQIQ